jgi:hypothetical protein
MRLDTIRVYVISKLGRVKQQQKKKFQAQERETARTFWIGKVIIYGESAT